MDFRQRLEQNRSTPVSSEALTEADEQFSCPYFSTERAGSPACLDMRLPDGSRKALPYSYFTEMNYEAEAGIEILTSDKKIKITGRNLSRLFDNLLTYRVRYVQANIGGDPDEDGLFVKEIVIKEIS